MLDHRGPVLLLIGLLFLAVQVVSAAPARANPCSERSLACEKKAPLPADPGHTHASHHGGQEQRCAYEITGETIPCATSMGVWSDIDQCYLRRDEHPSRPDQPGKSGAWYICHPLAGTANGFASWEFWLDQPPQGDPAQLAQLILARIQLQRLGIGITPEPGRTGVLGLPTYLWVTNPGARTLGPISDSATDRGVTVRLTARVSKVVWSLGDGTTTICAGGGTPYQDSFGARPSPTCGHTYAHPSTNLPGGVYPVTATAIWDVTWSGGGQAGRIPFTIMSGTSVRISEVQALI